MTRTGRSGAGAGVAVVVAVDGRRARTLADDLADAGAEVRLVVAADAPAQAAADGARGRDAAELLGELTRTDLLVLAADRRTLTAPLVEACDRFGVRIVALCGGDAQRRVAAAFGVDARDEDAAARDILGPGSAPPSSGAPARGRMIAVWGAAGSPGRTTLAIDLACELARGGRHVALVDADAHAPSVAMATGLPDEGPGFAAACRQAERGTLTPAELTRIAVPLGAIDVLTGINRPARWPELARDRVIAALECCRGWADDIVVDVAAPLERDEEIVSDLAGPRRNAATLAALESADLVVAVVSADPIGVSRFVRAYAELRAVVGATPVRIVANKLRAATLGIDARGQLRRTLERYTDARDTWFVPWDPKALDAATLAAQPVAQVAARSAFAGAVRRFVGEAIDPPVSARATRRAATAVEADAEAASARSTRPSRRRARAA
ncbi:AAA family ATPase [Microbacterium dextranolyticum]|uniref:Pilus biosynthesis protein CpaE n=1 Tax=Microbacterium dextranolyticum TaxID=36806 RepID=A0A9W6HPR9_9MICO|nr:P-loop NTPase [Microbacterium dextranolyticum]MBM7463709.1 MinD-like ATPase involved in chromosome partitioning or flagellar assembly [Microbacterium dextranolyticum]GLJ96460.1 pilus biosynthesis protein CpaE [Microbacterium dextranolyticum]